MLDFLYRLLPKDEKGQDLSEYAMLIGLIALIVVGAVEVLGINLDEVFTAIANKVGPWGSGG